MEAGAGELRQELADLREVVFNQQNGAEEEKAEESKISFPYHTSRRLVAFGGHDSWLREIKFKLPDVRFMSDDISSPEIIKRADVVWIQTNCIGHKSYNIIIDLARKYSRKVRYFAYASATKCAEQVVEEEENTDKWTKEPTGVVIYAGWLLCYSEPPRNIPVVRELSLAAFLVYIAAVLFYKPIFTQPLRFILCAA